MINIIMVHFIFLTVIIVTLNNHIFLPLDLPGFVTVSPTLVPITSSPQVGFLPY